MFTFLKIMQIGSYLPLIWIACGTSVTHLYNQSLKGQTPQEFESALIEKLSVCSSK